MALWLLTHIDPTADGVNEGEFADCAASRLLQNELARYCNKEVRGRSVLLGGYRGSGKTTLVDTALHDEWRRSRQGYEPQLRPLRVPLLGPNIFPEPAPATWPAGQPEDDERIRQRLLELVVMGLHTALSREMVTSFRELPQADTLHGSELAATLETRLPEGPAPAEMRAFWRQAGALEHGVLFRHRRLPGSGMRELSALSGIGYAYQRISGRVTASFSEKSTGTQTQESGSGWELKLAEAVKPLAALAAGTAVTVSTAAPGAVISALLLGLATTLLAGLAFRFTSNNVRKDEDLRDLTFLPDTSAGTLDRVLPALVDRLRAAGLAPVIVVDELDKVDKLWERGLPALLNHFKKLFAESVFTCLLVNRDFVERLRSREWGDRYGRSFSYFTHRPFVSYEPRDLHDYLGRVLVASRG